MRAGEPLGVDILRRNAPARLRHSSPCQGNLGRLLSPQMGFLHMFSGNWGWGGSELMRLMPEAPIRVHLQGGGGRGRVEGWRGGRGGQEVGTGCEQGLPSACLPVVCTGGTNCPSDAEPAPTSAGRAPVSGGWGAGAVPLVLGALRGGREGTASPHSSGPEVLRPSSYCRPPCEQEGPEVGGQVWAAGTCRDQAGPRGSCGPCSA